MEQSQAFIDDRDRRAQLDAAIIAYYDDIRSAMRRRGADQHQALEIIHDLYVNLSARPERIEGKRSLRAFLIRAALNLRIDRLRRASFEARLFAALDERAEAISAPLMSLHWRIDRPARIAVLQRAIAALPPQCRNVFIAHRIVRMDKDEIAEQFGIRRRMVDRHLRKALLACMEKMDDFERE